MANTADNSGRRSFLGQVAGGAVALAGATALIPIVATEAHAAYDSPFDDSWTQRVASARFKAVFDSPAMEDGLALNHALFFMQGFQEQFGVADKDTVPVLVMRHAGTYMGLNDDMWKKYGIGERSKVKDPVTGSDALRNPFVHAEKGSTMAQMAPESSLEALRARGAVLLVCNKAAMRYAGQVAAQLKVDAEQVRQDFRTNLVPGAILQPSGIYAVHRAQSVGCTFIKST